MLHRNELLGIIGYPLGHSLSPAMHNAAFRHLGWDCHYHAFEVRPGRLGEALQAIRVLGLAGINITIPYKEEIKEHLDELAPSARLVGAVNTVHRQGDKLVGHNTDLGGLAAALSEEGFTVWGKKAVVLGAGGAARAAALSVALEGAREIAVVNRNLKRAEDVAAAVSTHTGVPCSALGWQRDMMAACLDGAGILLQCTPLGMSPREEELPLLPLEALPPECQVYDLVYNPRETALVRRLREQGRPAAGGLGMLVHQAALAWQVWFGEPGPKEVMREAALRRLRQGGD